jgi:hypothetical protein
MILDTMDIPYVDSVKILCIRFTSDIRTPHNTEASTNQSNAFARWPSLFASTSCTPYPFQRLSSTSKSCRQEQVLGRISIVLSWFLWREAVFWVPLLTLHLDPTTGGMGLIEIYAKCMALFIDRRHLKLSNKSTTAAWIQTWLQFFMAEYLPDLRLKPQDTRTWDGTWKNYFILCRRICPQSVKLSVLHSTNTCG